MQFKKLVFLFYILLTFQLANSQIDYKNIEFISPIDYQILLSGNYGELRSSHFHAGIDIKTGGVTGKSIYAVEEGYIARIKVSANSYGKTLYINHPNGLTTVYAHLDNFNDKLSKYVKNIQYKNREFEINHFPDRDELKVKKGELIGFSGNTGSSNGPHLHFEIRKTDGQVPLNPLLFNFDIEDTISPVFYNLIIYPLDKYSYINQKNEKRLFSLKKINGNYQIADTNQIILSGNFGMGIEIYDYLNNSRNRCGVYTLDAKINNSLIYHHTIDGISFSETGYIKSHMDYEENLKSKLSVQKLFIDPNNDLNIYDTIVDKGIINLNSDTTLNITITANDVYGNQSILEFDIKGEKNIYVPISLDSIPQNMMSWNRSNTFINSDIKIELPKNALYHSINFEYAKTNSAEYYSEIHHIHNIYTPIHKAYSLSIKTKELSDELKDKALIVQLLEDQEISPIGGEVINGYIVAETKSFGDYAVLVDTIAPEVTVKKKDSQIISNDRIKFIIKDDLSGIKSFNGFIDNNWALFEYDMKNDLLFYILDPDKIQKNSEHELELFVVDNNNNVSTFYTTFYW